MQMRTMRNVNVLSLILAALVLSGCASNATKTEPAQEQEPPAETVDTQPIQETIEEESADFAADGVTPLDANGRPLARTFYFDYDKAVLKPSDLAALETHARILRRNPARNVVIEGHCDERGTREYNLALGERRANSIRSFLLSSGVNSRQMETVSYGEEQPEDPGHNDAAWARNRRGIMSYR